jgi:Flp pilus assembly protein TadD/predicted membrane-bound spermidine synthase
MAVELVAGRLTSRQLGTSLYTWTSVIGVVLAGLSAGNYLGGRLADRRAPADALAALFMMASIACAAITVLHHRVDDWSVLWGWSWPLRVFVHVAVVFLVPSFALGMVSPVAAKMALDRGAKTGRTIGSVYAWGMLGSIVGTFATGYWLVAAFGTAEVVWTVSVLLAALSIFFRRTSWKTWGWVGALGVLVILGAGPWAWAKSLGETLSLRESFGSDVIYLNESQYSHIRVVRSSRSPDRRDLHLDQLLHSSIVMDRPDELQYGYERIYGAVTGAMAAGRDSVNTLTIGGGGYVFPRYLQATWPRSRTEVVEIDPAVTQAAVAAFGLRAEHDFVVVHADGRAHLGGLIERRRRGDPASPYDFIYLDVFDHYSVPYQLTTLECLAAVDELLAEDGAFLMNLIDIFAESRFLGSMIETMKRVFPHVAVFAEGVGVRAQPDVRNTYILVGTKQPADFREVVAGYDSRIGLYALTDSDLEEARRRAGGRPLTDDWSPIENLLAPVVKRASREIAARTLVDRAETALRQGDVIEAERTARRALSLSPESPDAHAVLGNACQAAGDLDGAIEHYEIFLRSRPSHVGARVNLAAALLGEGRAEDAERHLVEAVRRDPGHALAHQNLGVVWTGMGRVEEAVAAFETALRLDPGNVKARDNLQRVQRELESARRNP